VRECTGYKWRLGEGGGYWRWVPHGGLGPLKFFFFSVSASAWACVCVGVRAWACAWACERARAGVGASVCVCECECVGGCVGERAGGKEGLDKKDQLCRIGQQVTMCNTGETMSRLPAQAITAQLDLPQTRGLKRAPQLACPCDRCNGARAVRSV
jgi:hypothetical protein